jgi:hypothetical protein
MPAKPRWLLQIPEIIEALQQLSTPVVDRALCEGIFGLRRRRTIDVMRSFGGYQAGNTILIDRIALIDRLREIADSPYARGEQRRKEKLNSHLAELYRFRKAVRVRIAVPPECRETRMHELGRSIQLQPGRLTIAYSNIEELLTNLYTFSQTAANDFEAFCSMVEAPLSS